MDYQNCSALVVGGGSGIGAELALALGEKGCRLILTGRTRSRLEDSASRIRRTGAGVQVMPCDVTDRRAVQSLARETGPVDILVYCAGGPVAGTDCPVPASSDEFFTSMADYTLAAVAEDDFNAIFNTNFHGGRHCIQAMLPLMQKAGRGRIIVVTSKSGMLNNAIVPGMGPYAVAKAALSRMVGALAFELMCEGSPVIINGISPGMIAVDFHRKLPEDERQGYGKPADVRPVFFRALEAPEGGHIYSRETGKTWEDELRSGLLPD